MMGVEVNWYMIAGLAIGNFTAGFIYTVYKGYKEDRHNG